MTADEFYKAIQNAIDEERESGSLYINLAKNAADERDKECLQKMAKQEVMHRAYLEWIFMKRGM